MARRRIAGLLLVLTITACGSDAPPPASENLSSTTDSDIASVTNWLDSRETPADTPTTPLSNPSSVPPVADMIGRLEQKLQTNPNDAKGWSLLAKSYAFIGQTDAAEAAAKKAISLGVDATTLELEIVAAAPESGL